jgi:hypothetical protein
MSALYKVVVTRTMVGSCYVRADSRVDAVSTVKSLHGVLEAHEVTEVDEGGTPRPLMDDVKWPEGMS